MPAKQQTTTYKQPLGTMSSGSKQKLFGKLNGLYSAHTISRASKLASQPQINPMAGYYYAPYATIGPLHQGPLTPPPAMHLANGTMGSQQAGDLATSLMLQRQLNYQPTTMMSHHELVNHHLQLSSRPLCRCRVMYLGSSVPHMTKNGLHGIQEPLRHLYPEDQFNGTHRKAQPTSGGSISSLELGKPPLPPNTIDISHLSSGLGIDSWLSVWSNGLLLENFDEFGREIKRFFSIESLHYCAAVRFFDTRQLANRAPGDPFNQNPPNKTIATEDLNNNAPACDEEPAKKSAIRFLPLDAPLFQCPGMLDPAHPPVFAAIMRRTTGIKVLECHAFICRRDAASNALVRCCTQAYADLLSARQRASTDRRLPIGQLQQLGPSSLLHPSYATQRRHRHRRSATLTQSRPTSLMGAYGTRLQYSPTYESVPANEACHAGRPSGAVDTSSEDNYASILRQTYGKSRSEPKQPVARESSSSRRRSRKGSGRRSGRSRAASTCSLFNDFMPAEAREPSSGEPQADKQYHSLEPLSSQPDKEGDTCCADDQVRYAVCRGGSKRRHSRSMQNLGQTGANRDSSRQLRRSRRSRRSKGDSRRAASYGEMPATDHEGVDLALREPLPMVKTHVPAHEEAPVYGGSCCARLSAEDHYGASARHSHLLARDQLLWQAASPAGGYSTSHRPPTGHALYCQPAYVPTFYLTPHGGVAPTSLGYTLPAPPSVQLYGNGPMYEPLLPAPCAPQTFRPELASDRRHPTSGGKRRGHKEREGAGQQQANASSGGKSLISRFRCLSPPINFIDRKSVPNAQTRDPPGADQGHARRPLSEVSNASFMSKDPEQETCPPISGPPQEALASPTSELSSATIGADNVISAAPGFIASRGEPEDGGQTPRKVSWIKRLSLTIGGAKPAAEQPARGSQREPGPNKKRGFFAGSLSIGRRRHRRRGPKLEPSAMNPPIQSQGQGQRHEASERQASETCLSSVEPEVGDAHQNADKTSV